MRIIDKPENRKISITFSLPMYIINWLDKMKIESPGFNRNKFIQDTLTNYMKNRGDYEN